MTATHDIQGDLISITVGSVFNCRLFRENETAFCWGDEIGSGVISLIPKNLRFRTISAGVFHVCGVLMASASKVLCWGRSLSLDDGKMDSIPTDSMISIVGGFWLLQLVITSPVEFWPLQPNSQFAGVRAFQPICPWL
ncbi:hypothetical protein AMTR_s00001p00245250 [Amborella trichopoda]|uniref:non-specific serine/threonine protein kinase n=1 Tax=Amborella trichopoda TaxID=13333 RepID=W1NMB5_AMBTC|nr:hypothetical protein AMTR_s00001p00245250 [Amborella trichopoda]